MSQGSQGQSTPTLHPVLQSALRSLDVNLEAELKRYRRYKDGVAAPVAPLPLLIAPGALLPRRGRHSGMTAGYKNGKGSDVISVSFGSAGLQQPRLQTASSDEAIAPKMPESGPSEQLGGGASLALTPAVPLGSTMSTGATQDLEVAISQLETEPDDYLESSAELLKSLGTPPEGVAANSTNPSRTALSKLLTPLGIGSMLLLLMTGGTLWFVGTHPSIVRHLRDDDLKLLESNPKQATKTTYPKAVDLNLDSLSTLPPSPSDRGKPVSVPVEPKPPLNRTLTPPVSVQIPAVVPIPITPTRDAAPPQYYYVVTPDRGLDSLEQIRLIIPQATVQDFPQGRKIQLGVFPEESRAKSLVKELADRGISAQIYKTSY